jgi:hypothetical protein
MLFKTVCLVGTLALAVSAAEDSATEREKALLDRIEQLEGDYVNQRLYTNSLPGYTYGGAWYVRYQILPKLAIAGRGEYMADRAGLFSGTSQVLREATLTTEYRFGEGFLTRLEWRRDFSNQPYFLTDTLGLLRKEQSTAEVGLVWWFGAKQGAW